MQKEQNTIGKDWFPGATAFVETFDTDNTDEPADTLSFESLKKAFATIHSTETELAETIPEIELSENESATPEYPDYGIDDAEYTNLECGSTTPTPVSEPPVAAVRLETIIEAMLFVGNRESKPITAEQVVEKMRDVSAEDVAQAADHLNGQYQERNCPYTIISKDGGYRMALRSEFELVRSNFYGKVRETRLSQQAIETLAVVAYRQPITAEEIQTLRRQSCTGILNQLVRRNLLRMSLVEQNKKNIVCYHTTTRFLDLFNIKSLDDIPEVDELDSA